MAGHFYLLVDAFREHWATCAPRRALLRPGRFDVEVQVPVPDLVGRKEILQLYLGKVKMANDVSVDMLARGTTGFTGADLENLVNQAALRAAIDAAEAVSMSYLENARDKVLMGAWPPSSRATEGRVRSRPTYVALAMLPYNFLWHFKSVQL